MSNDASKNKRGRPRVDSDEVTARFHRGLLDALEKWAADHGVRRSEAIRLLVAKALEADACEK